MADITVCAAILRDADNRILICRRGAGGSCAHLWEFPGGKLEKGETPEDCAVRECREELSVQIRIDELFDETDYSYPDKTIHFYFFLAHMIDGEAVCRVHTDMKWVQPQDLSEYSFCPADIDIVRNLQAMLY